MEWNTQQLPLTPVFCKMHQQCHRVRRTQIFCLHIPTKVTGFRIGILGFSILRHIHIIYY